MKLASASSPRPHPVFRALSLSALLGIVSNGFAQSEEKIRGPLAYLYIDANSGGSSGGHSAIRIHDEVYHYQHSSGVARLIREPWSTFRFTYTNLENRTIEAAELSVDPKIAGTIRQALSQTLLKQNRHFDYLKALENDVVFLEAISDGRAIPIAGAGFFGSEKSQHPWFELLRQRLPGTPPATPTALTEDMLDLTRRPDEDLQTHGYPLYPPTFSETFTDLYDRELALRVMAEDLEVPADAILDLGALPQGPHGEKIKQHLQGFQKDLAEGIHTLVQTPYPGHGPALLLALARYQLISRSLERRRIFVLDSSTGEIEAGRPDSHRSLSEREISEQAGFLEILSKRVQRIIRHDLEESETDEIGYHRLEIAATELALLRRAISLKIRAHFPNDSAPPRGQAAVRVLRPVGAADQKRLQWSLDAARIDLANFRDALSKRFGYGLIDRNCVTELIRSVNQSFQGANETAALGGHIDPDHSQSFVPFRFHELVKSRYRIKQIDRYPSYLRRRREQLLAGGAAFQSVGTRVLETSPLTSQIYAARMREDGVFLFFSDDQFMLRPLIGTMNLAYGAGASLVGAFSAPLDEGELAMGGLKGMVFSLPELAFWNIRKGTFSEFALADMAVQPHE